MREERDKSPHNSHMNITVDNREGLSSTAADDGPPSFVFVTPKTKASSMTTTSSSTLWRPPLPSLRRPQYPHLLADTPATSTCPYILDAASFDTDDDILQGLQDLADYQDEEEDRADDGHGHHDNLNLPPAPFPAAPRIRHRWQPRHRRISSDMSSIDMPDLTKATPDVRRGSYSTSATSLSSSIDSSSNTKPSATTTTTTTPGSNSSSSKTSSPSSSNNINNKFKRMSLHQFVTANPQAILSVQANTRLNWRTN